MITKVIFEPSNLKTKKLKAVFYANNDIVKIVHFGAKGYNDYIIYSKTDKIKADTKKKAYYARHGPLNKSNMTTPDTLSKIILWGPYRTINENIKYYKKLYKLK